VLDKEKQEGEGYENTPCKSRETVNTCFRFVKGKELFHKINRAAPRHMPVLLVHTDVKRIVSFL
jgi:hypothetical protein